MKDSWIRNANVTDGIRTQASSMAQTKAERPVRNKAANNCSGFTPIVFLVVIAIIGVLIALLLPAVQRG